ncbi:putative ABC transport system permease protein [Olsenella sp. KH3B4]|uniref:ABC transporter permease n=1 Tax=Olsenella sp. KH3B4 TaxID=1855394 RepID=UPI0008C901A0|nr:ABC transporter permease [Olsenella sp. KH3B4]SET24013.1 putative ABC transport system permease protein [Olsenella sp. KH3B4]
MGVFASYTLRSLRKNRTRTVVTVIGVILSTALLTGVVATATSVAAALLGRTIETEGSWQVFDSLQPAEADSALGRLATETNVATAMDSQVAGFASYASDADLSTTLLAIQTAPRVLRGSADQARRLTVMPTVRSGREPEAPGEVMLPVTFSGVTLADDGSGASAASDGPIELGSTVTLPLGATLVDGDSLGTPTTTRSFTVVGFYVPQHFLRNDFTAFEEAGATAIVSPNDVSNPVLTRVWVSTSGLSTRDALKGWAAPIFGEEDYYLHGQLLALQGMASDESTVMESLSGMVAVIGGVIVVAAIGMIGNSFSISVAERTRQFGLLSSLGASKRQLRRTVLLEAVAIGVVGIPVGLAAGLAGVAAMLSSSARAFDAMFRSSLSGTAQGIPLVISPAVVAGMAAASFLVLLASAWAPAWRASRVSAIDAIRQQQDIRLSKRTERAIEKAQATGKAPRAPLLERIAGLPGLLASRNLSRSSSRGRTVVVSLALSVVLIVLSGAISLYMGRAMDVGSDLGAVGRSDISLTIYNRQEADQGTVSTETLSLMRDAQAISEQVDDLTPGSAIVNGALEVTLPAGSVSADGRAFLADYYAGDSGAAENGSYAGPMLVSFVDDNTWAELCKEAGAGSATTTDGTSMPALALNVLAWMESNSVRTVAPYGTPTTATVYELRDAQSTLLLDSGGGALVQTWENSDGGASGSQRQTSIDDAAVDSGTITFVGTLDSLPDQLANTGLTSSSILPVIMPRSALEARPNLFSATSIVVPFSLAEDADPFDAGNALETAANATVSGNATAYVNNNVAQNEMTEAIVGLFKLLVTIFSVVCLLIAVANVFNTLSTSIILRTREFAVLQSVGLGPKGFRRMLVAECASYALRGLGIGLVFSVGVVVLFWAALRSAVGVSFELPWGYVAGAIAGVVAVLGLSVAYALRRSHALNIVEALRADAI